MGDGTRNMQREFRAVFVSGDTRFPRMALIVCFVTDYLYQNWLVLPRNDPEDQGPIMYIMLTGALDYCCKFALSECDT